MVGASLASVTVIATDFVAVNPASVAVTTTLYTLSAPASLGASKSGAALKAMAPVAVLMLNKSASAPDKENTALVAPSGSVIFGWYRTPVPFSAKDAVPDDVKIGASFTLLMIAVTG